jgi:hypothetical protein
MHRDYQEVTPQGSMAELMCRRRQPRLAGLKPARMIS